MCELSPAERYAAARARQARAKTPAGTYADTLDFPLDDFQWQALAAIDNGAGVLVAAPTGAGKTVVGQYAAYRAVKDGVRTMYTTPIKALSNQKYHDFCAIFGAENVGILTGDTVINPSAPIVVMTTEVLRNMLYRDASDLADVRYVVMDEVHYLADRSRGPVWEEVMILLPERVSVISLSATVSNAEEFGAWLSEVRGETAVIVSEVRPVPLHQHLYLRRQLFDLTNPKKPRRANPRIYRNLPNPQRGGRPPRPLRRDIIAAIAAEGLLPAIYFIFSRQGCEDAVSQLARSDLELTSRAEAQEIEAVINHHCRNLSESDRSAIGYRDFVRAAARGFAAHHAGMLPLLKECVEQLFVAGLLRVVCATETLALGINMPAKAVVLESLIKWDGTSHVMLSAGQYTQLIGRAGRRGIDVEGHAVVVWDPRVEVDTLVGLASTRTYPLNSAFRPTYSMAVNLLSWLDKKRAVGILESSFAQFQTDRKVAHLAARVRREEEALAGYGEALHCQCGDYTEYLRLQEELTQAEKRARSRRRADAMQQAFKALRPGAVIDYRFGRQTHRGVIVGVNQGRGGIVLSLVDGRGIRRMMVADDFHEPPRLAGTLELKRGDDRSKAAREKLARRAKRFKQGKKITSHKTDRRIEALRAQLRAHPSHSCPKRAEHEKWGRRYRQLHRELTRDKRTLEANTDTLGKEFARICTHLHRLGYLTDNDELTARGQLLRTINNEVDLVVTEVIARKTFHQLRPAALAGAISALVYQARGDDGGLHPHFSGRLQKAMLELSVIAAQIALGEEDLGITPMRELDGGLIDTMQAWASGAKLEEVLARADILPGDFVRNAKQCVDVIDQMQIAARDAGDDDFASRLLTTRSLIYRDIVAWSAI